MKQIFRIVLICLFCISCKKDHKNPLQQDVFVTIDNVLFNPKFSNDLKNHIFNIDTIHYSPYTLNGYGFLTGRTRNINFTSTLLQGLPVIKLSGWDDYGYTYIAKDTSGRIMELYREKFDSSRSLVPYPIIVFASKEITTGNEWNSNTGWERGRNTLYPTFKTKVMSNNATTTNGISNCIELEYSSPDFIDTMFFKPGKGPVEIRSWRAHLYENLQPGYGGYR